MPPLDAPVPSPLSSRWAKYFSLKNSNPSQSSTLQGDYSDGQGNPCYIQQLVPKLPLLDKLRLRETLIGAPGRSGSVAQSPSCFM